MLPFRSAVTANGLLNWAMLAGPPSPEKGTAPLPATVEMVPPTAATSRTRLALGFLLGISLIVGGLRVPIERYRITGQTLAATGVVSLYAVTFACNSMCHFSFFGPVPAFRLMTQVTAAAL